MRTERSSARASARQDVLDKGFVRLVDAMGGDAAVVDAARVCYDSRSKGEAQDRRLIVYLMKHAHLTPFEHAVFKFHVSTPIFVARQWFRHRIASYNEVSGRYTEVKDEFYIPAAWRSQGRATYPESSSARNEVAIARLRRSAATTSTVPSAPER